MQQVSHGCITTKFSGTKTSVMTVPFGAMYTDLVSFAVRCIEAVLQKLKATAFKPSFSLFDCTVFCTLIAPEFFLAIFALIRCISIWSVGICTHIPICN